MLRFFQFLYNYRSFFLFIALEIFSLFLVYQVNHYHGTRFFHSANRFVSSMMATSESVYDFFSLTETNRQLAEENARLREMLDKKDLQLYMRGNSTFDIEQIKSQYDYVEAKVINNTIYNYNNFITVNKGRNDGIEEGMAVLSSTGVAGIVRNTSENYSVLYSLLNSNMNVSVRLSSTDDIATVNWNGSDYRYANLTYLPRHVKINVGDTVITSGFNSVFPENSLVGIVEEFSVAEEDIFYEVKLKLATDFSKLKYVYVIDFTKRDEVDSLSTTIVN